MNLQDRIDTRVPGIALTASAIKTAMMTARIDAGPAWVWKTRRLGASLVWVSMIAKRISTLIAPM